MSDSKRWHKHKDGVWHKRNEAGMPNCKSCPSKNVDCAIGEDNKPVVSIDDIGRKFCYTKCDFYGNVKFGRAST